MKFKRNFFQCRISAQVGEKAFIHSPVVLQGSPHFLPYSVGSGLHRYRLCHIEPNPTIPVGGIVSAMIAANGLPQSKTALLNQIQQKDTVTNMLPCNFNDPAQPQIGQLFHGLFIALCCSFRQQHLVSEGRYLCDLFQIQPKRISRFQIIRAQTFGDQLHFLTQAHSCFTIGTRHWQTGKIQHHTSCFQILKGVFKSLFFLPFQQGQDIHG